MGWFCLEIGCTPRDCNSKGKNQWVNRCFWVHCIHHFPYLQFLPLETRFFLAFYGGIMGNTMVRWIFDGFDFPKIVGNTVHVNALAS